MPLCASYWHLWWLNSLKDFESPYVISQLIYILDPLMTRQFQEARGGYFGTIMTKQLEPSGNAFFHRGAKAASNKSCSKSIPLREIWKSEKDAPGVCEGILLGTVKRAQQLAEDGTGWEASNVPVFILDVYTISQPTALQGSKSCSSSALANISAPSTCQQRVSGSQVRL